MMNEKDRELLVNEYREDRSRAYAELSEKLGNMIHDLQQLQKKVDSARENNKRTNIDTNNITMLMSTMMMMTNTASRVERNKNGRKVHHQKDEGLLIGGCKNVRT